LTPDDGPNLRHVSAEREPAFVGMYWIGAGLPLEARLAVSGAELPVLRARIITAVERSSSAAVLHEALAVAASEHGLELDFEIADFGRGVVASVRMQPHDWIDVPRGAPRLAESVVDRPARGDVRGSRDDGSSPA